MNAMTAPASPAVLIVGAGPTGLMLACQLARFEVPFRIIDKNAGPSVTSKAMVVHARTLELYDQLGLAGAAIERGQRSPGAVFHLNGERAAYLPVGDIGKGLSPYPFVLALGQDANEKLLGEWLAARGHHVEWGTELVGYSESATGVEGQLRSKDGSTQTLAVAWLAGCDGAHSAVRHQSGIVFPGAAYEQEFFVADIVAQGIEADRHLNIFVRAGGFHLLFPMPGANHFRLIGIVPPDLRTKPDLTLDDIAAAVSPDLTPGFTIESHGWWSRYRISHRRAAQFRKGRAFLLGDAGHIHSPAGGQGMNTGLQDAANLGWKLALVVKGIAGEALLDSYAQERERVAQRLVSTTDRAFTLAVSQSTMARLFRTHVAARLLSRLLRNDVVRRLAFRTISQTGIRYRGSPLSHSDDGLPDEAVRAGDRLPWMSLVLTDALTGDHAAQDIYDLLRDGTFHVLLLAPEPASVSEARHWATTLPIALQVHVAPDVAANRTQWTRQQLGGLRALLIRPDGYIGWSGGTFDASTLNSYLQANLHLPPHTPAH